MSIDYYGVLWYNSIIKVNKRGKYMNKTKSNTLKIVGSKEDIKIDKEFLKNYGDYNFVEISTTGDCYICEGAFEAQQDLIDVNISAKNVVVGKNAFRACSNLGTVQIITKGKAVYMDEHSLGNCPKLNTVKLSSVKSVAVMDREVFCPKKANVNFCFLGREVQVKGSTNVYRQSIARPGPYLKGTFDEKGILFPDDKVSKYKDKVTPYEFVELLSETEVYQATDSGLRQELDYKFCPSIKTKAKLKLAKTKPETHEVRVLYR